LADFRLVPTAHSLPNPSTLEEGRLDELAARHGVTIAEVRRLMGAEQIERPRVAAVVDNDGVLGPSEAGGPPMIIAEDLFALDAGRLEELAATLSVTVGDVRRMIGVAGPRRDGPYGGRLDVHEIRRRYEAGESLAEIGAAMGASDTTVRNAMVRAGIPTRPGPRPAGERRGPLHRLDVEEVPRRREAGETIKRIARAIGASESGVGRAIKREGIGRGCSGGEVLGRQVANVSATGRWRRGRVSIDV
jgi:hypothetical protein